MTSLADSLLREGDYFNAITEYRRQLFRGEGDSSTIFLRMGYAFYMRGKYGRAAYYFSLARPKRPEARYLQALAMVLGGEGKDALLITEGDTSSIGILIRALTLASIGEEGRAVKLAREVGYDLKVRPSSRPYALASSVIPGSGLLLLGRYREGLVSLTLNLLAFTGAYYLLKRRLYYDLGLYVSVIAARFYTGGIERTLKHFAEDNRRVVRDVADSLASYIFKRTAF